MRGKIGNKKRKYFYLGGLMLVISTIYRLKNIKIVKAKNM